ncbi:hypothetical protein SAMN04488510_12034 [Fervidobacterium changbaicum]|uniref:Uncharacterized protein n=2 Tax=Fervidobacterium TaxID=2422 RepID=A0AAI8GCQ4_FERIS|nr:MULTISPECIES: hypothetical protein [Fervidobacterium]AMW32198.1 hypothetical protein NA23_02000 [Fervidobacterium islandicum]QAV32470.1 hypothetical protein CBS1_01065 [Fervidobacterium changbaicum]SDH58681.1 hypothetical protein SAMN04488510_12034 [Fervidobacterium changbaicum]
MRKVLIIGFVVLALISAFSFEISVFGGLELGGKNRPYVGARIGTLSAGISLMLEGYYPVASFEQLEEINIEEIQFVEIDPYLYLGIPLMGSLLYVGAAPIIIYDIKNTEFAMYQDIFHLKAGMRFGTGIIFFVEGIATMNTSFQLFDTYAVSAGVGIGF